MSTDLTPRPTINPPVIDGVYTHAKDVPARNPYRFATRASALILTGAAAAMFTHVDGTDLEKGGSAFALLAALLLFVWCLTCFELRAKAGDR